MQRVAAIPRQREEPELWSGDDTELRQRRASQSVSRYNGSRDRSQHRITGICHATHLHVSLTYSLSSSVIYLWVTTPSVRSSVCLSVYLSIRSS